MTKQEILKGGLVMKNKKNYYPLLNDVLRKDMRAAGFDVPLSDTEKTLIEHREALIRGERLTFGQCLARLLKKR